MDPVTQGVLGASAALIVAKNRKKLKHAAFVGAAAGMAPDLDILLQSSQDPLFALELHRQFTHSLVFIPFGGLIVAAFFWLLFYRKQPFSPIFLYATAGYATHGLIDSCTSYGTQLFWPFTDYRVAWDLIGIIDFFVTIPLLIGIIFTCVTNTKTGVGAAVGFFMAYMGFGAVQHQRALQTVEEQVIQGSFEVDRIKAMPTIGNLIVWRTLHEAGGRYYVNAVAVPIFGESRVYPGPTVQKLNMERDFPEIKQDSVQFNDVNRFRWFTNNWLVVDPQHSDRIADLRYSAQVEGINPLWSIRLDPTKQHQHVKYLSGLSEGDRDIIPFNKIFDSSSD